ncbi:MAG TPA: hypothetical protein PKI83_02880 [Bacteroidales bacterium]|nr:hypothetical protein [Bacteroidales bacterium]
MDKIPTAKQYLKDFGLSEVICEDDIIEFAKFHVQAALEAASEKAKLNVPNRFGRCTTSTFITDEGEVYIDSKSILNAYPLTNIK